jgi:Mg/Co/Ni transporter MgtE
LKASFIVNTVQSTIGTVIALPAGPGDSKRPARLDSVGACASTSFVKVPAWFSAGAALRVAQLKGVAYLLVEDRGAVVGTVSAHLLRTAPAAEPLARWMSPMKLTVSAETSRAEAGRLMECLGVECLPVSSGVLLIGLVTREDLAAGDQRAAG